MQSAIVDGEWNRGLNEVRLRWCLFPLAVAKGPRLGCNPTSARGQWDEEEEKYGHSAAGAIMDLIVYDKWYRG